jgi:hypothetical protein
MPGVDRVETNGPYVAGVAPVLEPNGYLADRAALDTRRTPYSPLEAPNLPNAFAKVVDAKSAVRFAKRFGLLGYSNLVLGDHHHADEGSHPQARELEAAGHGDLFTWTLAQARTVRLAIDLIETLQNGPDGDVASALSRNKSAMTTTTVIEHPSGIEYELMVPEYIVALRERVIQRCWPDAFAPRLQAAEMIADLVNGNSSSVRWMVQATPDGELVETMHADALVEVVWWHVGQWATRGKVRSCALSTCAMPFLVTDQRQQFCPSDYVNVDKSGRVRPGRSRCAALYQKRQSSGAAQPSPASANDEEP